MGRRSKLGIDVETLKEDVYAVCREYEILNLRQVYYRLIALHGYYRPTLVFYKYLSRWVTRWGLFHIINELSIKMRFIDVGNSVTI
jgi:hypothetical protein